jgi:hydrogenase-4 component E
MTQAIPAVIVQLDALVGGLFLLIAFAIVATRQMLACVRLFILQALLLVASAALVAIAVSSPHLAAVALITLVTKALVIPWLLRRTVRREIYSRREIVQVMNIPTALLVGAGLTLFAYLIVAPMLAAAPGVFVRINLPIGVAALLLGAYTVTVRREALSQLLGLLAMENGVFFAAVAIAPDLTVIAELAAAFDLPVVTLVIGLLTRRIHDRVGDTSVGLLAALREE